MSGLNIAVLVMTQPLVKVVIRNKETNNLFSRPRYMTGLEARNFKTLWDFHHVDGDYFISIEASEVHQETPNTVLCGCLI